MLAYSGINIEMWQKGTNNEQNCLFANNRIGLNVALTCQNRAIFVSWTQMWFLLPG